MCICLHIRYVSCSLAVVVFFIVKSESGGHEVKYSSDSRLYSCDFSNFESNRIARKHSNIRNFEYDSNIRPIHSLYT